ncbi:MAG: tetratricopeptide repeat protein [Cyclobacteriaceae bacterium]|nr:tetratricopeptide repeat protein [Cyclobacteriaceae bacterium]
MRLLILFALSFVVASFAASAQLTDSLFSVLDTARNERKVKTLNELFRAYLHTDPIEAIGYARQALNLATEINDQRGMAAANNNIGVAYRNQGAFDKALDFYIKSLRLYEGLDNKEGIAAARNNISTIYSIKQDYSQALKFLEESHSMLVELNDQPKLVGSLNNLGVLNQNLAQYEEALNFYKQSYDLSEKLGSPLPDPLNNIGNLLSMQNRFSEAIEYYSKALELEKKSDNRLGILNTLSNLGIAYTKANKHDVALRFLNEAYTLARELNGNAEIPTLLKNIAFNNYRQGKLKDAFEIMLQYDSAREKVYSEESSRRIAQLEMAMQLSDKEAEYESLKKAAELKTLQLRNSRLFIVAIILSLLLLVGIINYFFMDKLKELLRHR